MIFKFKTKETADYFSNKKVLCWFGK